MQHGKKYRSVAEKVTIGKQYSIDEALELIQTNRIAKFDESMEVHITLGIDPKKGDEQVRGTVVLPHGTGKTKRVMVITTTKASEAKEAGADVVGGEELIEQLKSGKFDEVDVIVATPEMMVKLAPIAKILGPRGLMPSPKTETVTPKVQEAVTAIKKGKVNFKNDPQGGVHAVFGKTSFSSGDLKENFVAFTDALQKAKQPAVKGKFIKSVTICSTMSPGISLVL